MLNSLQIQERIDQQEQIIKTAKHHRNRHNAAMYRKYLLGELVLQKQYEARREGRVG